MRAQRMCTPAAEFAADRPLSLRVEFGISGCVDRDARCTVSLDGGVLILETSALLCSTGCQPGGVGVQATCEVPRLAPGIYRVEPFNQTLTVTADGGATGC